MRRHASRLTMAEVERTMRLNFFSPVAITLALLPACRARLGTIVNVSSLGGRLDITTEAAYSGSKFALAGWSESLAIDLDDRRHVKLILPGAIDTEMWISPTTMLRSTTGPRRPRRDCRRIVDAIESDHFEHYLPDLKAVIEMKTADIDTSMVGMRAMTTSAMRGGARP